MRFSAIITTYNYADYLASAIDSVLKQDFPRDQYEILVVDDGSTDATPEVVRPYVEARQVRYFRKENGGHASALNLGYEMSQGEILVFLDADDRFKPDKLSILSSHYEKSGCRALFHGVELLELDGAKEHRHFKTHLPRPLEKVDKHLFRLTPESLASHEGWYPFLATLSGQSFSREACERLFPLPADFTRHTDLYTHFLSHLCGDIHYDPRPLSDYLRHKRSHTAALRRWDSRFIQLQIELSRRIAEEIRHRGTQEQCDAILPHIESAIALQEFEDLARRGDLERLKTHVVERVQHWPKESWMGRSFSRSAFLIAPRITLHLRKLKRLLAEACG